MREFDLKSSWGQLWKMLTDGWRQTTDARNWRTDITDGPIRWVSTWDWYFTRWWKHPSVSLLCMKCAIWYLHIVNSYWRFHHFRCMKSWSKCWKIIFAALLSFYSSRYKSKTKLALSCHSTHFLALFFPPCCWIDVRLIIRLWQTSGQGCRYFLCTCTLTFSIEQWLDTLKRGES